MSRLLHRRPEQAQRSSGNGLFFQALPELRKLVPAYACSVLRGERASVKPGLTFAHFCDSMRVCRSSYFQIAPGTHGNRFRRTGHRRKIPIGAVRQQAGGVRRIAARTAVAAGPRALGRSRRRHSADAPTGQRFHHVPIALSRLRQAEAALGTAAAGKARHPRRVHYHASSRRRSNWPSFRWADRRRSSRPTTASIARKSSTPIRPSTDFNRTSSFWPQAGAS